MARNAASYFIPSWIESDAKFRHIWAKSDPGGGEGESLTEHTALLLDNVSRLHARAPHLDQFACGEGRFWPWLAMAAALHDIGKCAAGFQGLLRTGERFPFRHEAISLSFVADVVGRDNEQDVRTVCSAIATHHRDLALILRHYDDPQVLESVFAGGIGEDAASLFDGAIRPRLLGLPFAMPATWALGRWVRPPSAPQLVDGLQFAMRQLRLQWREISRDPEGAWGTSSRKARLMRGALMIADHSASAHLPLRGAPAPLMTGVAEAIPGFPRDRCSWFPHQHLAADTEGHAVLIAPTGSGKTESALFWVSRQMQNCGEPTVFYVLPYQASMNAMWERLTLVFGPGEVTVQHSRAMQCLYRSLLDDVPPAQAARQARRLRNLSRVHASAFRVLSPYQLLRAAFGLKGHEALWTAMAGGLMIFDELHAYEPKRLGLILALIRTVTRYLGVRVFAMSATFPTVLLNRLNEVTGGASVNSIVRASEETFLRFRRHTVHLVDVELLSDEMIARIEADSRAGRHVLVVATTVARAQEMHARLQHLHPELLHGRFHTRDRSEKERKLLSQVASGAREEDGPGVLLVATQVVEVSLNVDFDVLYSDPAPLEALLQRFGRVNRKRGGTTDPKPVYVSRLAPEGSPVYSRALLDMGLRELAQVDGQVLSEDRVQEMLDRIYEGAYGEAWEREVDVAVRFFNRNVLDGCLPLESHEDLETEFEKLFDGEQVIPRDLLNEYRQLEATEPLAAPELLVPVTRGQVWKMKKEGKLAREEDGLLVADYPYGLRGLDLYSTGSRQPEDDGN